MRDHEVARGGETEGANDADLDDELAATGATAGGVDRDMGGGTTGGRTSLDDVPAETDDIDAGTAGGLTVGGGGAAGGPLGGAGASGARDAGGDAGGGATAGETDRDPGRERSAGG